MAGHDDYAGPARDAESFWEKRDYASALNCYTAARLAFLETYPGRVADPILLELKIGAARCLELLGHLEECVDLDSEVLNEREKLLKSTDENLLMLREILAANNTQLGKHEAALSLLQTNLKILESPEYGLEHEWTLQTKYSIAMEMSSVGEYRQALVLLTNTLNVMAANHFPHEAQEMVRVGASVVQEAMTKCTVNEAKDATVLSKKVSSAPKLSLPTSSETTIQKENPLAKDTSPSKPSKGTPPAITVSTKVTSPQELVNHTMVKLPNEKQDLQQKRPLSEASKPKNLSQASVDQLLKPPDQEGLRRVRSLNNTKARPSKAKPTTDGTRSRAGSCGPSIQPVIQLEKGTICHNEDGDKRDTSSERWLREIETYVHSWMPQCKVNDKIRIAILDTGIDLGHPYFDEKSRKGSTKCRREIVEECKSFLPGKKGDEDAHGHGTHAASLVLRLAPNAKVYVARVIDDDGEIGNPDAVAKAIDYASDPDHWGVHIISMSLGFKNIPESVERAIKKATMVREVLIFAAASNNGPTDDYSVTYPARAMMVFPVFAASSQGDLQKFNPNHEHKKGLSTLGVNVTGPWTRHGSKEKAPTSCRSGTSIATPIMAASAALALQFIYQKPPLNIKGLNRLKGIDGMHELLTLMIPRYASGTPYFIKPGMWLRSQEYAYKRVEEMIEHIWNGRIR